MAKAHTTKQRVQLKDLPTKERQLGTADMKKVKGGSGIQPANPKQKPKGFNGDVLEGTGI